MERRIIFLDVDGTLTEPGENEPPDSAVAAIQEARKGGHVVFLCTGRNYDMLRPLLKYGFDGVVASAGGYIKCQGKTVYDCPMTERQRDLAMRVLKESGIYRTVECMDGSYADEGLKEFLRDWAAQVGNSEMLRWREKIEKSLHILPMEKYQGQPVYKIVIMSRSANRLTHPKKILADDFKFCMQEEDANGFVNGEMINKSFDKGRAIKRVCEYLHIPIERSLAIGDSMNDKEMLETAGIGICMATGSKKLKELADDICPPLWEDGIYRIFVKYHLIG